jgi:hypothetical protein
LNIIFVTLAVVVALCILFVLILAAGEACRASMEPELLVIDEPLTEGIDYPADEEAPARRADGDTA